MAIETALSLRLLLHLPLRQTRGFLRSIFELMNLTLDVPDHTTLSRRSARLAVPLRSFPGSGAVNLVIDSSGPSIFGEGRWATVKHGGKGIQAWRELHLGGDAIGTIVAQALTNANVDDAATGRLPLLHEQTTGSAQVPAWQSSLTASRSGWSGW